MRESEEKKKSLRSEWVILNAARASLWEQGIAGEGRPVEIGRLGRLSALVWYAAHELESHTMSPCAAGVLDHLLHLHARGVTK